MGITIDDSDFQKKSTLYVDRVVKGVYQAIDKVANEIMRLSSFQVPHDTGMLQTSGHIETQADHSAIVGYNKIYAARLHEHPEYRFNKGRKGKYLEDPIKNNLTLFLDYIKSAMTGAAK